MGFILFPSSRFFRFTFFSVGSNFGRISTCIKKSHIRKPFICLLNSIIQTKQSTHNVQLSVFCSYLFLYTWQTMINLIKRLLIDVFSKTHKVDNLAMASKKKPLKKSYEPNTFLALASMHALFVEVTNSHQNTNRSIAFQSPKYFTSSLHTFSFS